MLEPLIQSQSIEFIPETPVTCVECGKTDTPTSDWHCRWCGVSCKYGWEKRPCRHCGSLRLTHRVGYRFGKVLCDCQDTPVGRQQRAIGMAKRELAERLEAEKEHTRRRSNEAAATSAKAALDCYNRKSRMCSALPGKTPNAYCQSCPKFGKAPELRSDSRPTGYRPPLQELPMEDLEFG